MARLVIARDGVGCAIKYYAQHEMQDIHVIIGGKAGFGLLEHIFITTMATAFAQLQYCTYVTFAPWYLHTPILSFPPTMVKPSRGMM
jgi:hypothetical protein